MSGAISEAVREFILAHIGSVVQLETLLLLVRTETEWTADAVARELRIEREGAATQLRELAQKGLLVSANATREAVYRFAPASPRLADVTLELAQAYEDRRVTIISLIYSKPSDTIRVFADAFRLRREDNDDG